MIRNDYSKKWWALIGTCLLAFTAFLDFTIVNTALPTMQAALHANVLQLQWVVNIFALGLSMFMITAGRMGDIFGHRRVYYFSLILFSIGAFGAGMSNEIHILVIFRALQAIAGSVIFTSSLALLPCAFPPEEHSRAIGIYSAITGSGLALGPFIGGILVSALSWRWVFFVNLPIVALGLIFCSFSLRESPRPDIKPKLDWWGVLLIALSIGSLVYGVISGEQAGWYATETLVSFAVTAIAIPLLIIVENKTKQPILDFNFLRNKLILLMGMTCVGASVVTYVSLFFNPLYLGIIKGLPAFYVGLCLVAIPFMQVIVSLLFERIHAKFSVVQLSLAAIVAAFIATAIQYSFTDHISYIVIIVSYLFGGITWAFGNTLPATAVKATIPAEKSGSAIGTIFTMWNVSGSIMLAIASVIFYARQSTAMMKSLKTLNFHLSHSQLHLVHTALSNPAKATSLLKKFLGDKSHVLITDFKLAFMSGFHLMVLVMLAFLIVIFAICFYLAKKINAQNSTVA